MTGVIGRAVRAPATSRLLFPTRPGSGDSIGLPGTAPIPRLIAGADCADEIVEPLRAALIRFGEADECADLRDGLCLARSTPVVIADCGRTRRGAGRRGQPATTGQPGERMNEMRPVGPHRGDDPGPSESGLRAATDRSAPPSVALRPEQAFAGRPDRPRPRPSA
jgi:hypothetical protein